MSKNGLKLNRRKFMVASSTAIAAPLLMRLAGAVSEAEGAGAKTLKKGKIYFINRECIGCQVCRTFCPAGAIRYGDCQNEIDQDKCIHCGTCYSECPISVISETEI